MKAALMALLLVSSTAMAGPSCVVNYAGVTVDTTDVLTAAPCRDGGMQKIVYVCVHTTHSDQAIKLSVGDDLGTATALTSLIGQVMQQCKKK